MTEPLWTSDEILAATGGTLVCTPFEAAGVSIDTRSIEPGDLFVALAGARDGHEFVGAARAHGAACALVSHPVTGCQIVVPDTLKALEALGVAARERASAARRGAVTGSVGKTSVTQALSAALALAGPSHASVKSYNNHIGVPLTLARMPRETRRAVFEIGMNHADEIAPLSRLVSPHAVAITTVGPVHMENFADGEEGVARAKAEIFAGLQPGGVAVLNAGNRWFDLLQSEAKAAGARVLRFGAGEDCEARLTGFEMAAGGAMVSARLHGRPLRFPIRQSGAHWGPNSLAVLLMLEALEVDLDTGLAALAEFAPLGGRGAEHRLAVRGDSADLIDESYNANPVSMAAAIASLGAHPAIGRRIAVLTDMLELGPDSPRFHAELAGELANAKADLVFCAGPLMRSLWDVLPPERRGAYAETAHELAGEVAAAIGPGDVIMVKGSNGSKAGEIVATLRAVFQDERADEGAAH